MIKESGLERGACWGWYTFLSSGCPVMHLMKGFIFPESVCLSLISPKAASLTELWNLYVSKQRPDSFNYVLKPLPLERCNQSLSYEFLVLIS